MLLVSDGDEQVRSSPEIAVDHAALGVRALRKPPTRWA